MKYQSIYIYIQKLFEKKNKMCDLCGNQLERTYTHSKTSLHRKKLFKIFKEIKKNLILYNSKKYGADW